MTNGLIALSLLLLDTSSPQGAGRECAGEIHCRRTEKRFGRSGKLPGEPFGTMASDLLQAKPHPLSPLDGRRKTEFDTDRLQIGFCEVAYTTEGKKAKIKNIYPILAAEIFCR